MLDMKNIEDYCNSIIHKMDKYYEGTENKDKINKLYREVYLLYAFGDLPETYFNKVSHAFNEMRTNKT